MVAIRGRTFKKPWQRSCLSSKLKSSSAPIGREDSWCFHAVGSSNAPLLGSTAAEGLPRIGRTSIATHWRSCGLPQSASCSENFVIPLDVFGQTLRHACSSRSLLMSGRRRIWPFSAVEFGRSPNRIEYGEGKKTDQEAADMRLPSDRLLDAWHAHGEDPEQNIDAEPDQHECEHPRIAKACGERRCRHPTRLGGISP